MRDRIHSTYSNFKAEVEKRAELVSTDQRSLLRPHVIDIPTFQLSENYIVRYPRSFRLLRSLAIVQWWFPEALHYRVWLDMSEMKFSWLNEEQRVELNVLLSDKDSCIKALYLTYTGNEVFGNIIGSDIKDLGKELRFSKFHYRYKPTQRKRGYDDKGTRRRAGTWLPDSDFTFTELWVEKEEELTRQTRSIRFIINFLRNLPEEEIDSLKDKV